MLKSLHQGWLQDVGMKTLGEDLSARTLHRTCAWLQEAWVMSFLEEEISLHTDIQENPRSWLILASAYLDMAVKLEMCEARDMAVKDEHKKCLANCEAAALEEFGGPSCKKRMWRVSVFVLSSLLPRHLKNLC